MFLLVFVAVIVYIIIDSSNNNRDRGYNEYQEKPPASLNRKSERDMMKENQNENLEKTKESRKMEGDDKVVTDNQKIDKIVGRKKFDKIGGSTRKK